MILLTRLMAGDPSGLPVRCSYIAVCCLCYLEGEPGSPEPCVVQIEVVQLMRRLLQHPRLHLDAAAPDLFQTFPVHVRIGIFHRYNNASEGKFSQHVSTGWRLAVVAAGLQGHVDSGTLQKRPVFDRTDGIHFSVGLTKALVVPLTNDITLRRDDDTSKKRIQRT